MSANLRSLLKKERQLRDSVNLIRLFLENYSSERDNRQISVRLQKLEEVGKDFLETRAKIEMLLEDESTKCGEEETAEAEREKENFRVLQEFDDEFCNLKAELLELQMRKRQTFSNDDDCPQTRQSGGSFSKVKLPEINLPVFSGKIREWVTFRDTFRSLIHNNTQLTPMDRFTYLRSSLSGDALQKISSIEQTAANYEVAWEALEKIYENKKLIVKAHLDSLFSLDVLKRESYEGLNHLISEFERNIQMLEKIGQKTAEWSTILAYMVGSRLDTVTLRHWETHHNSKDAPSYNNLLEFLRNHCAVLQAVASSKPSNPDFRQPKLSVCHTTYGKGVRCPFCNDSWHSAFKCAKFQKMKISERIEAVAKYKLCRNCLHPGHFSRTCEKGLCHHCQQRHHSMLHVGQVRSPVPSPQVRPATIDQHFRQPKFTRSNQIQQNQPSTNNTPVTSATSHSTPTQPTTGLVTVSQTYTTLPVTPTHNILLSTAIVKVTDSCGNFKLARALLDSGSQHCLMTSTFLESLRFKKTPSYLVVQGIGSSRFTSTTAVSAEVAARTKTISLYSTNMHFYVLPRLTVSLPTSSFNPSILKLPESTLLADPLFYESSPIDIIIGAEYYFELLREGQQKATSEGPAMQNTLFGWVLAGKIPENTCGPSMSMVHVSVSMDIQEQLTKFWELETCRSKTTYSLEETACEEFFEKTTVRDETGRFIVTLPKKKMLINQLGNSKDVAAKRFMRLEKRFSMNAELKKLYTEFIHEYLALEHMKPISEDEKEETGFYLPHHAVLKPHSTTTKLRVVFDASCKTSTGVSLNDALMVGPVVQEDLLDIILRFRVHKCAIVADIAKMYRMIGIHTEDQRLQRILWRDSPIEPIRTFELATVTYGTASAPYLATKCLQKLADEGVNKYPTAARVLKQDFYIDDLLTGTDNFEDGVKLVKELIELLESGGFSLRKWNSNCEAILKSVPSHLRDDRTILDLDSAHSSVKTLGLIWEPRTDTFRFSTPAWTSSTITKRTILADISRLFDPLGVVGPVIIQAKIFLQELWKQEYGWDDKLSVDIEQYWIEFRRNLAAIDGISVPRWVGIGNHANVVQFHGFCDASEKAYGACIFVRTVYGDGQVNVQLLTSKSRVAPLENLKTNKRKQSIPRLELSSALLLSHLYDKVITSLRIKPQSYFWTDSTIVRCWLASPPSRWKEFVANRVSEIQHLTRDGIWQHIAGVENPADIISRGMIPAQLHYQTLWFRGPSWLIFDESHWPKGGQIHEEELDQTIMEKKSAVIAILQSTPPSEIFSLKSALPNLIRIVAIIYRFRYNAQKVNHVSRRTGAITYYEYEEALHKVVRLSQQESFPQEMADLSNGRQLQPSSRIISLNPVLMNGLICVGGRLSHANITNSRKHPYVIDHPHPLAEIILTHYHRKLCHAGQQILVSAVRERFWPVNARNLARKVIHNCVACFRAKPRIHEQLMADLPPERVTPCSPFQRVGVDYCGPFYVAYPNRRSRPVKSFVAVYVCLVVKAVHLELVADLTTQAFLASLRRFVSRRGRPSLIMCDNATNFVGAKRELQELRKLFNDQQFQETVMKDAVEKEIEFKFIPARSPNFGGLWESTVKSFKTLFKRTIGTHILKYDEMVTILAQIEGILNSRPLTPLSNDPDDFEALTPGHFLIHRPLTAISEPGLQGIMENRLSAWQKVQRYVQSMWIKWSEQYLSNLHNRTKWTRQKDNIAVGTMVVLKEDNTPPLKWHLGRVTEIHAGPDGNVRVVTVRTKYGSFRRAISKICILPIRDNTVSGDGEN
ncbi:uncharacterized protein LOC129782412 [Toxorhynchites rutilus septentrionalis]|uniref:uncharacterized protein LOC129782412 n=1 Tax=Toxorhynchites rutilus septentrionalis TaxID=329112 RepID=UPI00247886A0|nr:uncharacterized protein LOC129782412 [Toxorhynchites rutilus septentrionalis]